MSTRSNSEHPAPNMSRPAENGANPATLSALVASHEEWLMERVLFYAKRQGYTRYTSTLLEAWRASIVGLSNALIETLQRFSQPPEFGPDDDFRNDPSATFGIIEARLHRDRGVTLAMFLGLMKYYRQAYQDLLLEKSNKQGAVESDRLYLDRFFDRVEIGYSSEWLAVSETVGLTDLQNANRTLTNEKNKYLTIFESLHSPVILVEDNNRITNFNQQAATLFSDKDSPGSHYYRDDDAGIPTWPWLQEALHELDKNGCEAVGLELDLQTNQGLRRYQLNLKRMLDISGKFSGTVVILNDVSELRWTESRMQTLLDDLQRSNKELENFAYVASHDLQEPLRMVTSYLQLLERRCGDRLDSDGREFLQFAVDGAQRMKTLILDLLTYSRVGRIDSTLTATDLNDVMQKVLNNLGPAIAEHGAVIEIPPLPTLDANQTQMGQLFQNLLSNALKFSTGPAPLIRVTVEETGNDWAFSISDNGIGIAPEYHERIFVIFQRLHGKKEFPGTGIGLALCRKIVEHHGGKIRVESTEGAGATFHFTLSKKAANHGP